VVQQREGTVATVVSVNIEMPKDVDLQGNKICTGVVTTPPLEETALLRSSVLHLVPMLEI
jgi:hypothetical protein